MSKNAGYRLAHAVIVTSVGRMLATLLLVGSCGALRTGYAAPPKENSTIGMGGTIGPYPVGMVIRTRDDTHIAAAHYAYARTGRPIPLTGDVDDDRIRLAEPGGGVFHLHFTTHDGTAPEPLDFQTSTGLLGTWDKGTRHLPVSLTLQEAGGDIPDCAPYPATSAPNTGDPKSGDPQARFPSPGCTHTPDRARLDQCIAMPFTAQADTTRADTARCIDETQRPCRQDQADMDMCIDNVHAYLDQTIARRLKTAAAPGALSAASYPDWTRMHTRSCKANATFSPGGSGYGADIETCMSIEMLRLLQNHMVPVAAPADRAHHPG